jgi:hypothetical protein
MCAGIFAITQLSMGSKHAIVAGLIIFVFSALRIIGREEVRLMRGGAAKNNRDGRFPAGLSN